MITLLKIDMVEISGFRLQGIVSFFFFPRARLFFLEDCGEILGHCVDQGLSSATASTKEVG
jgi:hypothetical protein